MKEKNCISKIKYGELHLYYPLKFETDIEFKDLCKKVDASDIAFQTNLLGKTEEALVKAQNKVLEEMDEAAKTLADKFSKKIQDGVQTDDQDPEDSSQDGSSIDKNTGLLNEAFAELRARIDRLARESSISSIMYGDNYSELQQRFILYPFHVELNNGKKVWMNAILYVFKNSVATLKLELPLVDVDAGPLKENTPDDFVKRIINACQVDHFEKDMNLSEINECYFNVLKDDTEFDIRAHDSKLKNITLIEYDEMPEEINNLSAEFEEELFEIISAPVPDLENYPIHELAQRYVKDNSWTSLGARYLSSRTGKCLAIADKKLLGKYLPYGSGASAAKNKNNLYRDLASQVQVNVELALLVLILIKTNTSNNLHGKSLAGQELSALRTEYNENLLLITKLQESSYGSADDQVDIFEKIIPHYLKSDLAKLQADALDNIILEEEQTKQKNFQKSVSVGGFIVSVVFGLPAISNTLKIIFSVFNMQESASLDIASFALWALVNLGFLIYLLKKR